MKKNPRLNAPPPPTYTMEVEVNYHRPLMWIGLSVNCF